MTKKIQNTKGAGGGKSSGGGGSIAADSFTTNEIVQALHLLGEGPLNLYQDGVDYVYPGQSIFVNNVPLQNIDGTYNLGNTLYEYRSGESSQSVMTTPAFPSASNVVTVGIQVFGGGGTEGPAAPVIYTTSTALVDFAYVNIEFPQGLFQTDGSGNVTGWNVQFTIDTKATGDSSWTNQITQNYSAMLSQPNVASYLVNRPTDAAGSIWDIRISRQTPDNDTLVQKSDIVVSSIEECEQISLPYDGVAYCGLAIDASNLGSMSNSVPTFAFLVQNAGIQIPDNYDPATWTFTGLWDGNFTTGVTDDPAWILYDMLTNENYGCYLYGITAANVDKYSFYNASVFNNGLVPNGNGGTEPRFTFNAPLQNRQDMLTTLQNVAGMMNAVLGEVNGLVTLFQDRPTDSMYLVNKSTAIRQEDGSYFNYVGSSLTSRTTVVNATWSNASDVRYLPTVTSVQDPVGIARYGYIEYDLAAFGATTESQAIRAAKWWIYSNEHQTDTVQFQTGLLGLTYNLYDVFDLYDEDYTEQAGAGTILSATSTTVTLDKPVVISGSSPTISVLLQDGVTYETRNITNSAGTYQTLTISAAWSETPVQYCPYLINSAISPRQFRIIDLKIDGPTKVVTVIAQLYFNTNYATIEEGYVNTPAVYTQPTLNTIANPTNLVFTPSHYVNPTNNQLQYNVIVSWTAPTSAQVSGYVIKWSYNGQPFTTSAKQQITSFTIPNIVDGTYSVIVYALNTANTVSTGLSGQYVLNTGGGTATSTGLIDMTGLTIVGGGTTFVNQDCNFTFTNPSSNQGLLKNTQIEFINYSTSAVMRTVVLPPVNGGVSQNYTYTFAMNQADGAGRKFIVQIKNIDTLNNLTGGVSATFNNPTPATVSNIQTVGGILGNSITWNPDTNPDLVGYLVWRGTTNSYTLSSTSLVCDTASTSYVDNGLTSGTEYYYVIAAYDVFGKSFAGTGLNLSAYTGIIPTIGGVPSGSTLPGSGTTGETFFDTSNSTLYSYNGSAWLPVGVQTGATLPGSGTSGQFFANTTNGQLYVYTSGAWVAAVPAVNITGTITSTQIGANAVTTGAIAANAVTAGQIAANTITAGQIAANTITAAQIASGTITAGQIQSSTITAGQIAANTITSGQIAAGTITASNLAANTITASSGVIANLAVGTLQLANNAVTIPVGATASGTPASCSVTLTQAGSVQVIGFINYNGGGGGSVGLSITKNGGSPTGTVGTSVSAGYQGCSSTSAIFTGLAAGTYTFALAPSLGLGITLLANSIIAIGIMR